MKAYKRWYMLITLAFLAGSVESFAKTVNGNEVALYYSEAKTDAERKLVTDEYMGCNGFFRYLRVDKVEEGIKDGRLYWNIKAMEPSSSLYVVFQVIKTTSMNVLLADPETKVGDAIAVKGTIRSMSRENDTIVLRPVLVKHKDKLHPKIGKEMLYEADSSAQFYSFTGGYPAVNLGYRDRDLLEHKKEILNKQGAQAWTDFLLREISKRERERKNTRILKKRGRIEAVKQQEEEEKKAAEAEAKVKTYADLQREKAEEIRKARAEAAAKLKKQ